MKLLLIISILVSTLAVLSTVAAEGTNHLVALRTYATHNGSHWNVPIDLSSYQFREPCLWAEAIEMALDPVIQFSVDDRHRLRRAVRLLACQKPNVDQRIQFSFGGQDIEVISDSWGNVRRSLVIDATKARSSYHGRGWHEAHITLKDASGNLQKQKDAQVLFQMLPNEEGAKIDMPSLGVICDVDDTVRFIQGLKGWEEKSPIFKTFKQYAFAGIPRPGMARFLHYLQKSANGLLEPLFSEEDVQHASAIAYFYVTGQFRPVTPIIEQFIESNGFPAGALIGQDVWFTDAFGGLRDAGLLQFLKVASQPHIQKLLHIQNLLNQYVQTQFLLIGDSGEHDPATYARFMIARPHQVRHIVIFCIERDKNECHIDSERFRDDLRGIDKSKVTLVPFEVKDFAGIRQHFGRLKDKLLI